MKLHKHAAAAFILVNGVLQSCTPSKELKALYGSMPVKDVDSLKAAKMLDSRWSMIDYGAKKTVRTYTFDADPKYSLNEGVTSASTLSPQAQNAVRKALKEIGDTAAIEFREVHRSPDLDYYKDANVQEANLKFLGGKFPAARTTTGEMETPGAIIDYPEATGKFARNRLHGTAYIADDTPPNELQYMADHAVLHAIGLKHASRFMPKKFNKLAFTTLATSNEPDAKPPQHMQPGDLIAAELKYFPIAHAQPVTDEFIIGGVDKHPSIKIFDGGRDSIRIVGKHIKDISVSVRKAGNDLLLVAEEGGQKLLIKLGGAHASDLQSVQVADDTHVETRAVGKQSAKINTAGSVEHKTR